MHLAYCSDNEVFQNDRLRDKQWSYNFPGSGWITCLYRIAAESSINVASGDVAIENIKSGKWSAKDVYVIQDMNSMVASALLDLGAEPFLIVCLEAPLYAPSFYDNINRIAGKFKFSLGFGFSDSQPENLKSENNIQFRFPSYYLDDMREICPWGDRKNLVLVAANKYKTKKIFVPARFSLIGFRQQIKSATWKMFSPAYRRSLSASLHDHRLEMVEYFAGRGELDIYGAGWAELDALPATWAGKLKDVVNKQYLGRCNNKLETISNYRFSACFENMALDRYVTEKIVDCFVAGTVPLYLGAPDIETIVPASAFIDMRKFSSFGQVDTYMKSVDEHDAIKMIEEGRNYLRTDIGLLHSYEGFARNVIRLAGTC